MKHAYDLSKDNVQFGDLGRKWGTLSLVVGVVGLAAAAGLGFASGDGGKRFFWAYLVAFAYFLAMGLGALVWVMIQHMTRSGWSVLLRRIAEGIAGALPMMALLFVPLLFGLGEIYHWAHPEAVAHDPVLAKKAVYLNVPFFIARWAVYFAVWCGTAWSLSRASRAQDASGDPALTLRMQRISYAMIVPFAVTLTFASFDLLMSLDPHWFSSIFGVYFFAGAIWLFFAVLPIVVWRLQANGRLAGAITPDLYQEMGKLLFAFGVFWAYIAFSQFMLIWYANIPEETSWYLKRWNGGWPLVGLLLIVGHFFAPFLVIMSRAAKRNLRILIPVACWAMLMQWFDFYYIAMPEYEPGSGRVPFSLLDLAAFLGVGGLFFWMVSRNLASAPLVPVDDPRLQESLVFEEGV